MLEGVGLGRAEAVSLSLLVVWRILPKSTREGPPPGWGGFAFAPRGVKSE